MSGYSTQYLKKVGTGWTATVFFAGNGKVIKEFKPQFRNNAAVEYRKTIWARSLGIPAPEAFELCETGNGNQAIVMEYVEGEPSDKYLREHPARWFACLGKIAKLSVEMHSHIAYESEIDVNYRDMKGFVLRRMRLISRLPEVLPDEIGEMRRFYEGIPASCCFCHGDYRLKNIVVSPSGEVRAIDFGGCGFGSWLFDLLGLFCDLYRPYAARGFNPRLVAKRLLFRFYLNRFLKDTGNKNIGAVIATLGAMAGIDLLIKHADYGEGKGTVDVRDCADRTLAYIRSLPDGRFPDV